ncbi:MAG: class I SAM-dependent methyltransferase [Candidatus Heimdallarchaeota archaeon]|nr:class I SAM-dependent methyltransferase [Candidatus Heimdallarchaeota archaeon]
MTRIKDKDYYSKKLFASKLKHAYEIAPPRIQQYLEAEILYVLDLIQVDYYVLELGCGYGRVLKPLAMKARKVVGIDIAEASLNYARKYLKDFSNVELHRMTARNIQFKPESFDTVLGIQNAISAMKIDPIHLITQALRVTKRKGKLILSSYSDKIWDARLNWFEIQSKAGLLGELDYENTKNGTIACRDGFKATTFRTEDFSSLVEKMNLKARIEEVDKSSIFCIITK